MAGDTPLSLAEVEAIALGKVNRITREYWTQGAGESRTVRENASAFDNYWIRPRALRDVQEVDMSTSVLGQPVGIPVGIAPSGWHKMADPVGEAGTARAAKALGTAMGVSMGTCMGDAPGETCSPEDTKAAGGAAVKFFQLYIFRDREATKQVLQRVERAGYEAVMVTVDTAHVGRRVAEIRNRRHMPRFLRVISFGSQVALSKEAEQGLTIDAGLVWAEIIPWLRRNTRMQIWLKGIVTAEDAALAVKYGVDGIVVSNHGGRQLDGCIPTVEALPEVVAAVGGAIPVHLDGGIRRGGDVFRALALGADFVWIGRPALWGLAYDGQRGVELVLEILREELKGCMALAGCASIAQIDACFLRLRRARLESRLENCRAAHARCDDKKPVCGRCSFFNYECARGLPFPFRHSNNPSVYEEDGNTTPGQEPRTAFEFSGDQVWVETPRTVDFVFEYLPAEALETQSVDVGAPTLYDSRSLPHQHDRPTLPLSPSSSSLSLTPEDLGWLPECADTGGREPRERGLVGTGPLHLSSRSQAVSRTSNITTFSSRCWSLGDENEVLLFRHFVANLSLWFDYCDPYHTFATSVAQRAISSPPLLYAILATSARHLRVTAAGRQDTDTTAENYHRECLALLIPILNDSTAALDEALFAATVVLRLYEEISVPFAGQDIESHLKGSHTFVRALEAAHMASGIRQAALRVVLRQEIVIAFRTQRPVELLQEYVQVDQRLGSDGGAADDWAYAFHVIVLCAEVLTWCYGEGAKTRDAWKELLGRAQGWMDNKPASFEPLLYREQGQGRADQVFPEIWHINDCHVAAHQHYLICQILLVAHDPGKPQLGPRLDEAVDAVNTVIRKHVRSICGIALSNKHCIPSMFTASMVIGICGDLFVNNGERKAMLDILMETDVELAWPTASSQAYLRRKWEWSG